MNLSLILLETERQHFLFIISDTDDTFNFVVSIMYSQLFNLLCDKADDVYGGRLPVHVRCLLDEFANIGLIPKFEKLIATIRSREISASIILQAQSQLKAIYRRCQVFTDFLIDSSDYRPKPTNLFDCILCACGTIHNCSFVFKNAPVISLFTDALNCFFRILRVSSNFTPSVIL